MKEISYVIWGICDQFGYKESISTSFDNNLVPPKFKKSNSFGDENGRISFAFSNENTDQNHFFSIERVDNDVLYTIYRTNWFRGTRNSYDAATLIINEKKELLNPIDCLTKIMSEYVSQKIKGLKEFNFNFLVSSFKTIDKSLFNNRRIVNDSTHAYIQRNDKKGYLKYSSEKELREIFIDHRSKLYDFNKVFFFTKLKFLEEGSYKLTNLDSIKPSFIKIENYNSYFYEIYLNGNQKSIENNTLKCFEGDKLDVKSLRSNKIIKSLHITTSTSKILLEKIDPVIRTKSKYQKSHRKPRNKTSVFITTIFLVSFILLSSIIFFEDLKNYFFAKEEIVMETYPEQKIIFLPDSFYIDMNGTFNKNNEKINFDSLGTTVDSLEEIFNNTRSKNGISINGDKYIIKSTSWKVLKNDNDSSLTIIEMDTLVDNISKFNNDLGNVLIDIIASIRDVKNNKIEDVKENGVDEEPKLKKEKIRDKNTKTKNSKKNEIEDKEKRNKTKKNKNLSKDSNSSKKKEKLSSEKENKKEQIKVQEKIEDKKEDRSKVLERECKKAIKEFKDKYRRGRNITINRALRNLSKDLESNNDKIIEKAKNDFKNFYEVVEKCDNPDIKTSKNYGYLKKKILNK